MILQSSQFVEQLLHWFDRSRRDLPWRLPRGAGADAKLNPYHVLISEAMLQQTQVSTVVPYFKRFTEAFPTLISLAQADERQVLRLWQGLGYYSRARNVQNAVRKIVSDFGGVVPDTVDALLTLPGVGRYTAGAVASIAYNRRAPILDGNVARVLCRLDKIQSDPREPATRERLWRRAEEILPPEGGQIGDFNSALMELGATVCVPRNPQCLICPVRNFCEANKAGLQDRIPAPRKSKATPLVKRWAFCIRRADRYLIEQRPAKGRWAGMWQFVTLEPIGRKPAPEHLRSSINLATDSMTKLSTIRHALTHRRYHFDVYVCHTTDGAAVATDRPRKWVRFADIDRYPFTGPHLKMLQLLRGQASSTKAGKAR